MHSKTSGFIIRVRWSDNVNGAPHITLQNVSTKEVLTLNSWTALLEVVQRAPEHHSEGEDD